MSDGGGNTPVEECLEKGARNRSADRRAFLRTQLITGLGFCLSSCKDEIEPAAGAAKPDGNATVAPSRSVEVAAQVPVSTENLLLFRKDDARYEKLRRRFNKRVQSHPAVIVLCRDTNEISTAVRYARQEGLAVSVKSGGHSFEGLSTNDGGLVVDLGLVNQIEWIDDEMIRVGPGCTVSELYDALLPRGRFLPLGSCGGVGVGGLTLGGGYGLFSRQFGLTCDSLTELTLVDGTGAIRNTSTDAELLWACRGGGNGNFGVASKMTFRTYPAPTALFSHRFKAFRLDPARAARLMETWFQAAASLPLTAFSAFVLNGKSLTILVTDTKGRRPAIDEVLSKLAAVTDRSSYGKRQQIVSATRRYYGIEDPIYFKNASAGFYTGFEDLRNVAKEVAGLVGNNRGLIFQINTLGGNVANPAFERVSAFPHRDRPFLAELQAYYDKPGQEVHRLAAVRKVQSALTANGVNRHYRNYPDLDLANWESAYYGDSYRRLQRAKQRYDPHNLFRHPQSVRPR